MVSIDVNLDANLDNFNRLPLYDLSCELLYDSIYSKLFSELDIDCKYYSLSSIVDTLHNLKYPFLSVFHVNIQSLASKFQQFRDLFDSFSQKNIFPDIFGISETWINNFDNFCIPNYRIFSASRSSGRGGGVAIYAHNSLISSQIDTPILFHNNILESVLIKISKNGLKSLCLCVYRPNTHTRLSSTEQLAAFFECFNEILNYLDSFNLPVIILGDLNLNLFHSNDINSDPSNLLDTCLAYSYIQSISRATRVTPTSSTLIDHIF